MQLCINSVLFVICLMTDLLWYYLFIANSPLITLKQQNHDHLLFYLRFVLLSPDFFFDQIRLAPYVSLTNIYLQITSRKTAAIIKLCKIESLALFAYSHSCLDLPIFLKFPELIFSRTNHQNLLETRNWQFYIFDIIPHRLHGHIKKFHATVFFSLVFRLQNNYV